ncbi:MAG: hypothetical protein ACOVQH_10130 [Burkholderiaceae bacterium]|jgi:hypothetical protein
MANDNPYEPTNQIVRSTVLSLRPSNRAMWKAYFWSPSVAPFAFVVLVLLIGIVSEVFGLEVNPASMLVLPFMALTVGLVSCYFVAGIIGMPIAFYLRRVNALNFYSIHGAAFCWAVLFSIGCAVVMVGDNWGDLPLALGYLSFGVIPPVLLSGTVFWLLLKHYLLSEANAER